MHIVFAVPSYAGLRRSDGLPSCAPFTQSLCDTLEACRASGHQVTLLTNERSCYIQTMRNELVRDFLATTGNVLFFLDDDLSWTTQGVATLLASPDLVAAGTYRMKSEREMYCGVLYCTPDHRPVVRASDGALAASHVATGFLKIHRKALDRMVAAYPERTYHVMRDGHRVNGLVDLFPQGIYGGVWMGEDFAFCRLWTQIGGEIWLHPDVDLTHWDRITDQSYPGNFHQFLQRQPGGAQWRGGELSEEIQQERQGA